MAILEFLGFHGLSQAFFSLASVSNARSCDHHPSNPQLAFGPPDDDVSDAELIPL